MFLKKEEGVRRFLEAHRSWCEVLTEEAQAKLARALTEAERQAIRNIKSFLFLEGISSENLTREAPEKTPTTRCSRTSWLEEVNGAVGREEVPPMDVEVVYRRAIEEDLKPSNLMPWLIEAAVALVEEGPGAGSLDNRS